MTISELFEAMPAQLNTKASAGLNKTLQWNITGDEPGVWALQIVDGVGRLIPGGVEKPDVTFTVEAKDWLAMAEGKLKVTGDMTLAMKVPQLLPTGK
jgi:putative sterol carrier protein